MFYKHLFYILSDILVYIQNFLISQNNVYVYEDVVKQVGTIFELRLVFASDLIKAIKKDKSWALASRNELKRDKLLAPLLYYMKVDCVGRNCWKGALKIINQDWGLEICSFF